MPEWRLEVTADFKAEVKACIGRDAKMHRSIEKKLQKIRADPERVGVRKTGPMRSYKSERVGHYVIIFEVLPDAANPPGVVKIRAFFHHNDPHYDP